MVPRGPARTPLGGWVGPGVLQDDTSGPGRLHESSLRGAGGYQMLRGFPPSAAPVQPSPKAWPSTFLAAQESQAVAGPLSRPRAHGGAGPQSSASRKSRTFRTIVTELVAAKPQAAALLPPAAWTPPQC